MLFSYVTYFTSLSQTELRLYSQNFIGSIDNVSVKEVIDTNNIPRISYDSNGDNGHILLEPTSTNLVTYSEDFENGYTKVNSSVDLNELLHLMEQQLLINLTLLLVSSKIHRS